MNNKVKIFQNAKIIGIENIEFGEYVIIDDFAFIYAKEKIKIGNYVHIASFTSISGGGEFIMEDFTGIGSGCRILTATDDFKNYGFGNPTIDNKFRNNEIGKVKLEKFAIIGANCVILPNVIIGEGATIGAGSIITKDVKPWTVIMNSRFVGNRSKEEVLKNYEVFLNTPESERIGNLFK
jgi:acetyltransferase-like isoleucine patch superfamily enzyme